MRKIRIVCAAALIIYLGWLLYFTVFARSPAFVYPSPQTDPRYNLVPFREIWRYIRYRERLGPGAAMLNLLGNIVMFVPIGALWPVVMRRAGTMGLSVAAGLLISFIIECTQVILRVGSFDIDDLILNTLGACLGFLLYRVLVRKLPVKIRKL